MAAAEVLGPHLQKIKVPGDSEKIFKEECVFSFDTPDSETGLYVSLNSFIGLGREHVERYFRKTGNAVYLHLLRHKREIPADQQGDGPEKKITRLAIGVEGGFDPDCAKKKYEYEDEFSIVVLPSFTRFPWPSSELPEVVRNSVRKILEAESAAKLAELEALTGTWDGEARIISKHAANLLQLDNGKKIPPSGWKCEECDLTENLWMNLTDGSILCGRRFHDGSGGNNHAKEHYAKCSYPLAVKLGTITKDGKGDVFSYDEDDMVEDPSLPQHLAHFGINVAQMEKTEKSMAEMELDLNQQVGEWKLAQEGGHQLSPLYGPGYTGLVNLGNTCYLNSIMQVLFSIPDFCHRFVDGAPAYFDNAPADPASDFNVQMAKLGVGLLSGKYSKPPAEPADDSQPGVSPRMFKALISRGHPEFTTKRQQDAQEFFMHLVNTLERNSRHQENPSECFKFSVEDRFQCMQSRKVKYTHRAEYSLPLAIPLEAAVNKEEVAAYEVRKAEAEAQGRRLDPDEQVRPRIKLFSCLEAFAQPETIPGFYSTAVNGKTTARKTTRLSTFPDYLMLHLKKFMLREDWVPMKLDVAVDMPDELDLATLRGTGLQPDEEVLPELADAEPMPQPFFNPQLLGQLLDMGFPPDACKKALYFTDNAGIDEATNWLMTHISDSDFSDPFVPPGADWKAGSRAAFVPNEDSLAMIEAMGFTRAQATKALKATDNNVERAADWIFNHQTELDAEEEAPGSAPQGPKFRDGGSKYRLVAFITHMGSSSMVGHYVCHILRDDHWVVFNDNKVAVSENPPKELGYLYLYKRM